MPLFRALTKNMAPMTNADESPTNRLTLFPIYLSLFIVSTLCSSHETYLLLLHDYLSLFVVSTLCPRHLCPREAWWREQGGEVSSQICPGRPGPRR